MDCYMVMVILLASCPDLINSKVFLITTKNVSLSNKVDTDMESSGEFNSSNETTTEIMDDDIPAGADYIDAPKLKRFGANDAEALAHPYIPLQNGKAPEPNLQPMNLGWPDAVPGKTAPIPSFRNAIQPRPLGLGQLSTHAKGYNGPLQYVYAPHIYVVQPGGTVAKNIYAPNNVSNEGSQVIQQKRQ